MNKLRAEVLYNRALIWLEISLLMGIAGREGNAWLSWIPALYYAWNSFSLWNEDE